MDSAELHTSPVCQPFVHCSVKKIWRQQVVQFQVSRAVLHGLLLDGFHLFRPRGFGGFVGEQARTEEMLQQHARILDRVLGLTSWFLAVLKVILAHAKTEEAETCAQSHDHS